MHLQDKDITGSPIPESHVKTNKDLKVGDPKSRGMNNEEKKADKARKEGKTGEEANASKQGETSHGEFHSGDPKSRGMNNAEKKADKAVRQGNVEHRDEPSQNSSKSSEKKNPSATPTEDKARREGKSDAHTNPDKKGETSHGTSNAGNSNSRGMNNEEKKADKARREGKMPPDQGPGRANDDGGVMQSTESGTPAQGGAPTKAAREKTEMSTGPGGAGQGEGLTPDIKGGRYEKYKSYEGTAIVSDSVEPAGEGGGTPLNEVDMYGSEEPALGKERESTLESEADVAIAGQSEEEAPFGDEDKKKVSKTGLEEAEKASRQEKPTRQSGRIKQSAGNKRKMREERESEGLLVSEDEERVKKASKKEVGPGI